MKPIWKCPESLRVDWPTIEAELMPLIEAKARHFGRYIPNNYFDYDDVVQEGRIALLEVHSKYDSERGEFSSFANVVLNNRFKTMIWKMLTKRRTPRSFVKSGNKWVETSIPPLCLEMIDVMDCSNFYDDKNSENYLNDPYKKVEYEQAKEQVRIFNLKMIYGLKGTNKQVFECIVNPSIEFLKMVQNVGGDVNKPTNKQIAEFLNIKLNAVLWSISQIRMRFTELAKHKDFSELWVESLRSNRWPMIHISKEKKHDTEFVNEVIINRGLDPRPIHGYTKKKYFYEESKDKNCIRLIEQYPWGVVLVLKYKEKYRTFVLEGKFSLTKGIVTGKNGAREKLPISWYKDIVKELRGRDEGRKNKGRKNKRND